MNTKIDSQNKIPFIVDNAEITIFPNMEDVNRDIVKPIQTHSNRIVEIITSNENLESCDGLYTQKKDIVLAIYTSDCAPICFISSNQIGIIHCGWRGLVSGIIENLQNEFEMDQTSIYIAPFLHRFEIQKDFCYEAIYARFGERFFIKKDNKIFFEFKQAIQSLFTHVTVFWDSRDTESDLSLPSYRRTKVLNNFITTIKLQ
jgi:YfiH family protein